MRGKRARPASSSPQYERVIWVEQKTARGSKITAKVSGSPRTPKIRRQTTPLSKMRRLGASPITQVDSSEKIGYVLDSPVIGLKKKTGKVCFTTPTLQNC
jgi:hypothetical protein